MKKKVKRNIFLALNLVLFFIMIIVSCLFLTGKLSLSGSSLKNNKASDKLPKVKAPIEVSNPNSTKSKPSISIKNGDTGDKVKEIQKKLYNIGKEISVDGSYGVETGTIVAAFQKSVSIPPTSIIDDGTYNKLMSMKDIRTYGKTIPGISTSVEGSKQVIVVTATNYGLYQVSLKAYEIDSGSWDLFDSVSGVIGKNGFSDNKKEGDLTTPTGKYGFAFIFGWAADPGFKMEFKKAQVGDYWVSNKTLSEYNVWMHYSGNPDSRFYDYSALWKQPLFKYAAVINYNYSTNKVLNKGSGIFLHLAPKNGGFTLGCVGIEEGHLVKLLKWLEPSKNPVILMGVKGHI